MTINKKNLKLLVDYIENRVTDDKFDMEHFRSDEDGGTVDFRSITECGTIGCAIGYAPFIYSLAPLDDEFDISDKLSFEEYSSRIMNISIISPMWDFLFDSVWQDVANRMDASSRLQFIKRGRYVLELEPSEVDENIAFDVLDSSVNTDNMQVVEDWYESR